jgi:hypothetical protein
MNHTVEWNTGYVVVLLRTLVGDFPADLCLLGVQAGSLRLAWVYVGLCKV